MGHLHYVVRDVAANKAFWVALGGKPGVVRSVRNIEAPHPRRRGALALQEIAMEVKADITADAVAPKEDWVI